ncbi:MAG TPA: S9 family peptidase [Candidatus Rubrimentiphilum sp.]|nr:S9 family peptidase [Candidatus Rubrimentiphilum sp.]
MIRRLLSSCLALAFIASLSGVAAAAPRPVAAEDLFKFTFITNAHISPDGTRVVFVATKLNGPKETYDSNLYLVPVAGGEPKRLTNTGRDDGPAWSPDSRTIAFTRGPAKKGLHAQIFAYDVASGTVRQLTRLKQGASGPVYSHDGKRIAFRVVSIDPAPAAHINFAAAGFKPKKDQDKSDVRIVTNMHFEGNGAGYTYDRHPHIWVMNADGSKARALTSGSWAETNARWSPDDTLIAFDSLRYHSPSLGPNDIYTIPSSGGTMRKLASDQPANGLLDFDRGHEVWFFSGGVADPAELPALVRSRPDGSKRKTIVPLNTVDFGDSVLADMGEPGGGCGPYFAPGESFALMNANEPGYSALVKVDPKTGAVQKLTTAGEASDCSMDEGGRYIAYELSDFTHPREVYLMDVATGQSKRLTGMNDALMAQLQVSTPQPFTVTDDAGFTVHAWFMPAIGAKPGVRYPTILDIHGGPETQFGETFFHEFQYWAGLGYNVVFSDPRGSVGFGYPFEEALAKHWGTAMFDDVQRVMDEALKRPDVDPNRLGVSGGSYGGYATLWVVGHTNRYKAAIAERVVSNLATEQLAADLASDNALGGRYSWGLPWQPGNLYLQESPISYVANATTPLLILHSEEDTRTPIDQTLQWFNASKILGRTVEYVIVPGENHDLSRVGSPIHRVERLRILSQWFAKYLRP